MRALSFAAGLLLFATSAAGALPLQQVIEESKGSVAHLSLRDGSGREFGSGSGFVVSGDGKLATNFHVVDGASEVVAVFGGGQEVAVEGAWAIDAERDLAILQLERGQYRSLKVATRAPTQGEPVVVIGSPLGLDGSVSTGIVSALRSEGLATHTGASAEIRPSWGLQITAAISAGSSGSPVLDADGGVIGVAVGQRLSGQALNFAVPGPLLVEIMKKAEKSVMQPLPEVRVGRSVGQNLGISAGFLLALGLVWWLVARRGKVGDAKKPLVGLKL